MGFGRARLAVFAMPLLVLVGCSGSVEVVSFETGGSGGHASVGGANNTGGTGGTNVMHGTAGAGGTGAGLAGTGSTEVAGEGGVGGDGGEGGAVELGGSGGSVEHGAGTGGIENSAGAGGAVGGTSGSSEAGAGGEAAIPAWPPFSSPTTLEQLAREPKSDTCTPANFGEIVEYDDMNLFGKTAYGAICQSSGWSTIAYRDPAPAKGWYGFLSAAVDGKLQSTAIIEITEEADGFLVAQCELESSPEGSLLSADATSLRSASTDPAVEKSICELSPALKALGTFKVRLIIGAPTLEFYPKSGADPVPMKLFTM